MIYNGEKYNKITIDINEVKVGKKFREHLPHEYKIHNACKYYKTHGKLDKLPVLNRNFYLHDGYARYLAAKLLGLEEIEVFVQAELPTCYVYGIHPNNEHKKEYVWRVPTEKKFKDWHKNVLPGDIVQVKTCHGNVPIIVTRIEWSEERPRKERIRSVCA